MHVAGNFDEFGYPRFSQKELDRRRQLLQEVCAETGVEGVVLYGEHWTGSAVPWLSEWPTTRQAAVIVTSDEQDLLLVQHHNHLPQARQLARRCAVRWGGPSTIDAIRGELEHRRLRGRRIGWIGTLSAAHASELARDMETVDLSTFYTRLRLRKSDEELAWLRKGARFSDAGLGALLTRSLSGLNEYELGDLIERAYVPNGGTTVIHHLSATSMTAPDTGVPRQHRTFRRVRPGDAVTVEISAAWWGYPGQVLRTLAVEAEPTPLFIDLHAAADAAFAAVTSALRPGTTAAEIVEASSVIEDAGFTIIDDLVHGFGGGYLPPVLGSRSRSAGPVPDFTFESGMTVVVQPNVVTPDWRAGVQTGELIEVTEHGARTLHRTPRGLLHAPTIVPNEPGDNEV